MWTKETSERTGFGGRRVEKLELAAPWSPRINLAEDPSVESPGFTSFQIC